MSDVSAPPISPRPGAPRGRGQLVTGCLLVVVGLLFLMDQYFEVRYGMEFSHFWPVILITIGLAKIATPRHDGQPTGGYMLTMVGVILLMHTLHVWSLRTSWPLFIVAAGINVLAGAIAQARFTKGNGHVS